VHGNQVLQAAAALVPSLAGGSADLEPSTRTAIQGSPSVARDRYEGRNLHFGVREHAMGAILNGMAATGGFIPYGSSFLVFTDYARPSIRLAAIMKLQVIWVLTHDSVFLGEDGPTHQPIEQLTALRAIPNLLVLRPADGLETAAAWGIALGRAEGPSLLALTRQTVPALERPAGFDPETLRRGGYVLVESPDREAVTLIATGSEVALAVAASKRLAERGLAARVVSMMSPQLFLSQPPSWRQSVLPPGSRRASIEAGATAGWWRIVGRHGLAIGIDRYGESAPYGDLARHFGLTPEAVADQVAAWAARPSP
jgi:transketolase